jgi:hypothetical protein
MGGMNTTDRTLALLSPMWQRIARGEVDLSTYTDDEILSAQIRMADGRLLPTPAVLPDTFIREQVQREMRKAQKAIRRGALDALEVYETIMNDEEEAAKDRLKAGEFFLTRFLGKEAQHVHVHDANVDDAKTALIERLLAARKGLPAATVVQMTSGVDIEDAELVEDDAVLELEDLL